MVVIQQTNCDNVCNVMSVIVQAYQLMIEINLSMSLLKLFKNSFRFIASGLKYQRTEDFQLSYVFIVAP